MMKEINFVFELVKIVGFVVLPFSLCLILSFVALS